jgi:signal transduction histidine kinase
MSVSQSRLLFDETATTERLLAYVRSVLALATLIVAVKLFFEVQFEYRPMALTLELVMTYSLVMSFVTRRRPAATRKAAIFSSIFEVVLITALVASTGGTKSPFYLWYVFYIVSVSLRYGLQLSIVALAASIVSYTIITTSAVSLSLAGETFVPAFLGSTGFLFILALLFGHMSERQKSYRTQLAVVNDLGIALSSLSTVGDIEAEMIRQTAALLQVEQCCFAALPEPGANRPPYWVGENTPSPDLDLGEWAPERIAREEHSRVANEIRKDGSMPVDSAAVLGIWSIAAVPLLAHDTWVGVLYAVNRKTGSFSATDIRLLDLIASQAAPLLENARLAERLRETAASEERLRIARDLHDNFLQTLAAIRLHLERCSILVDKDPDKAKEAIGRTQEIAAVGLTEVRSYLSQLRLAGPEPEQLRETIKRFAEEAAASGGLNLELAMDLNPEQISRSVCASAFQILRELITNVVKHSQAANLRVSAISESTELVVSVSDDGRGFDVDNARLTAAATGHLGLVGVEERVKAAGGHLSIQSAPGEGATVTVRLPTQ